jgi:para-nitrobenzyl esterase
MSVAESRTGGSRPEVRAAGGELRGSREDSVAVFRGIPFAEPPVGELRFSAPRPARGWNGVREAFSYGPPPPQGGHFGMDLLATDAGADDWLTLNVWSPDLDSSSQLPVMVWIQGGGYVIGTSGLPEYDGARLARDGGVVVVTFNYRVGIEGFAAIEGAPPNRGLLDQVAALEWVRDNVRAFGGDPDQVTIFGQSAGGGSVAALLAMDSAAGLFRRAIVQSMPGAFFSRDLAADIAAACAAELGMLPTRADLSLVPPRQLSTAGDTVGAGMDQRGERWGLAAQRGILFAPVLDGDILAVTPWRALAEGGGRSVELLVGYTRDEHRLFTAIEGLLGAVTDEQAAHALEVFAPGPDGARRYRDAFPAAGPEELYELVHSDWLFRMPSLHLGEAQTAGGGSTHVYELTWCAPGMGGGLGACHGLDVPLVFGNLDRGQAALLIGQTPSPQASALSARMRLAWTSFAAHGAPGWPAYKIDQRLVQRFDATPDVLDYSAEPSRLIWENHAFPALGIAPEGRG